MKPAKGFLYQIRYELVDQPGRFIEVKTTRPETIPGDVAIAGFDSAQCISQRHAADRFHREEQLAVLLDHAQHGEGGSLVASASTAARPYHANFMSDSSETRHARGAS